MNLTFKDKIKLEEMYLFLEREEHLKINGFNPNEHYERVAETLIRLDEKASPEGFTKLSRRFSKLCKSYKTKIF